MGTGDSGCESPGGGSVGWVSGVPGGLNGPGVDSVGLSGITLEVGREVSPVLLFSGGYQGNLRISNSLCLFEPSVPLEPDASFSSRVVTCS